MSWLTSVFEKNRRCIILFIIIFFMLVAVHSSPSRLAHLPHEPSFVNLTLAALKPLSLTVSRSRCHFHSHSRGAETTLRSM